MSVIINNKKFLKMLKSTILDFEHMPLDKEGYELLADMRNIYQTQSLSVTKVMYLFSYLMNSLNRDLGTEMMSLQERSAAKEIRHEHKYMVKYLKKFFTYKEMPMGSCFITENISS